MIDSVVAITGIPMQITTTGIDGIISVVSNPLAWVNGVLLLIMIVVVIRVAFALTGLFKSLWT